MKIIGLLGGAGSGKSETAKYLCAKYGGKLYSFAEPLKEIVRLAFDLSDVQVYGTQETKETVDDRYGVTPRWLLQRIGTEGIRNVLGPDFWWEHCMKRVLEDQPELAVIDDFRFVNETEGFLSLNDPDRIVDIWRMEPLRKNSDADQNHQSEAEWTRCPYTQLVMPEQYGLEYLYEAIDEAAFKFGLLPTVRVLA